jgi:hypothetical protein
VLEQQEVQADFAETPERNDPQRATHIASAASSSPVRGRASST